MTSTNIKIVSSKESIFTKKMYNILIDDKGHFLELHYETPLQSDETSKLVYVDLIDDNGNRSSISPTLKMQVVECVQKNNL